MHKAFSLIIRWEIRKVFPSNISRKVFFTLFIQFIVFQFREIYQFYIFEREREETKLLLNIYLFWSNINAKINWTPFARFYFLLDTLRGLNVKQVSWYMLGIWFFRCMHWILIHGSHLCKFVGFLLEKFWCSLSAWNWSFLHCINYEE